MAEISRENERIYVEGRLADSDLHYLLANIYNGIEKSGYQDLTLDFSACERAYQSTMLGVCAQALAYRDAHIDFTLIPPRNANLARLFRNSNWGNLIDPRGHEPSSFSGHTHVPATNYRSPRDQYNAVKRITDVILGAVQGLERTDFAAFEWAINEVMDNVLTHSKSNTGGLVQVSTFKSSSRAIQFIVADAGIGIPTTLREGHPDIDSDTEALDRAIREGVTRDATLGQGNGLFGTYQICTQSRGRFRLESGHAVLVFHDGDLQIMNTAIPYAGTLVVADIDFSNPGLLGQALKFKGRLHKPADVIELNYELEHSENLRFVLEEESDSFGNRPAGTPVRTKLMNLTTMGTGQKLFVDLRGIPIVSSSFADEVFGKLFVELGPMRFSQAIELVNVEPTVAQLIDRAIAQRMSIAEGP